MQERKTTPDAADLTQIHGIGPGVARRLSDAGIQALTALAAADPEAVAAALRGMPVVSSERIQEWIEAANRLAPPRSDAADAPSDNGQHYATFRLELLLDPRNEVRRTRVSHVQSGAEENWAGWAAERLLRFVAENAGLQSSPPIVGDGVEARTTAEGESAGPRLHDLDIVDPRTSESRHIVHRGQPYDVRFGVAMADQSGGRPETARLTTTLYARSLAGEQRYPLARHATTRPLGPELDLSLGVVPAATLSPGAYRLEVELDVETEDRRQRWPTASLRQGMVIVF